MNAPTNTDIDFIGNSSEYNHLIRGGSKLTKDEISFGMNLRQYKNTTQFNANEPWHSTTNKAFSPRNQYDKTNAFLSQTNKAFEGKFKDKHHEKNVGEIMHMVRRNDMYENIGWMTSLRNDRGVR